MAQSSSIETTYPGLWSQFQLLPGHLRAEVADFVAFLAQKYPTAPAQKPVRQFGFARNTIVIKPGFDDPLEEFNDYQ